MTEAEQRLRAHGVTNTILFFGSARARPPAVWKAQVEEAEAVVKAGGAAAVAAEASLARLHKCSWMSTAYDDAAELAERVTAWAMGRSAAGVQDYVVCTGGGPGMMEAANMGAARVPGAVTMGMGISLPFEAGLNDYVTKGLGWEFHYFFTRKYWLSYFARAIVVTPGGLGTLDELFEILTLLQTHKIKLPRMPIVLLGGTYWKSVLNLSAMVDAGTISQADVDRMHFTDSVEDAFTHITTRLAELEADGSIRLGPQSPP